MPGRDSIRSLHAGDAGLRPRPEFEGDMAFVMWVLQGIETADQRARWVQRNLPGTASLMGVDLDLAREVG